MNRCIAHPHCRRGVLLLVVLSMLTLFMLLGTAYLVVSTRSRITARAFNRLVMLSDEAKIPREAYLDRVFMHVVRGGTDASIPKFLPTTSSGTVPFESLLDDKYGRNTAVLGTFTASSATTSSPVLTLTGSIDATTTGTSPPTAPELPGRVLTFCPKDGEATSHRILAAGTGSPLTLVVDIPTSSSPFRMPEANCRVVINGREFDGSGTTNESWDAFDNDNPFLARIDPSGTSISSGSAARMSYGASGTSNPPDTIDADGDGQKDSLLLDFNLPSVSTVSGTIDLHAAVLIVDLDSRFNVNAHGALPARIYPAGSMWPTVTGTNLNDVPIGSGYGPPEVNGDWMYPQTATGGYPQNRKYTDKTTGVTEDNTFAIMVGSGTAVTGRRPLGSRFMVSGSTPALDPVQGRYGERLLSSWTTYRLSNATSGDPLPGQAATDDTLSQVTDKQRLPTKGQGTTWTVPTANTAGVPSLWWSGANNYDWTGAGTGDNPRASYNSPPDLHGRMKTVALPPPPASQGIIAPRLAFAKVEWGNFETTDDPYELVLGSSAPQNGWMADPNSNGSRPVYDNAFSIAELEPVLRPYDSDTFRLPMRLAATLGSLAEESRLRVTTSSWDTTAITGTAAANLTTWLKSVTGSVAGTSATSGSLGGEAARWEKFNLNRPLTSTKTGTYSSADLYYVQRQAYFKDLYTLICALLHPSVAPTADEAKEYAQWAANVVEFRDADSTMTPFEYDANIRNGWAVDGDANTIEPSTSATTGTTSATTGTTAATNPNLVWGTERPEILIMETSAWENDSTGELFITLHRPWNAVALSTSGSVAGEPCDAAMDVTGTPKNQIDLGRPAGSSSYPIWRLRLVDQTGASAIVRLDPVQQGAAGANSDFSASAITDAAAAPKMAADSWLCVHGNNALNANITSGTVFIDQGGSGTFRMPGAPLAPGTNRGGTVFLERLTDPSATVTGSIWGTSSGTSVPHYHVVDQAPVEVVNRTPKPPPATAPLPPPSKISRDVTTNGTALWRCPPAAATAVPTALPTPIDLGPKSFPSATSKAVWFPWPNRPFVSAAELFLVPAIPAADITTGSSAVGMLKNYTAPSATNNALLTLHSGTNQLLLLDAVHVPTRFSGIHRTITSDSSGSLKQAGIHSETTPVNQISSYREPGRVNLNTITADDVWNAVVAGPLANPTTATGQTAEPAPLKTRSLATGSNGTSRDPYAGAGSQTTGTAADFLTTPATCMGELLQLQGTGTTPRGAGPLTSGFTPDKHPTLVTTGTDSLNPAHLLYTANRLANTATIRSNVFAVWITLRESILNDPDSVKYHRAFYIVDRSIPVAHEPGKDHNVWDSVLLRRIIE